jgi:hypothetical protein
MASPAILAFGDPAATNNHIVGPLVVACSIISIAEVTRPVRWVNLLLGAWLVLAPWVLGFSPGGAMASDILAGVLVAALATWRGARKQRFGGGWSALFGKSLPGEKH